MNRHIAIGLIVSALIYVLAGTGLLGKQRSRITVGLTWLYGVIGLGEFAIAVVNVTMGQWLTSFYTAVMGILYCAGGLTLYRLPRHESSQP